jgi:hypothetical protein
MVSEIAEHRDLGNSKLATRLIMRGASSTTRSRAKITIQGVTEWLRMWQPGISRLAARPRLGHIGLNGAVAEWLKAAVC